MALDLVLLAAGRGRRFGGFKQTAPVGPRGQALCEYTIFDALLVGFDRVILVTSPELAPEFAPWAAARFGRHVPVHLAVQAPSGLPAGRVRPWGTGHAVLAAAEHVAGPFAVVNADDHYGVAAMASLARFLRRTPPDASPGWAMVGFSLVETLPPRGGVSRAICRTDGPWLTALREHEEVARDASGALSTLADGRLTALPPTTLVSMNAWAFLPDVFARLHDGFTRFRADASPEHDEYHLPTAVSACIAAGQTTVRVLPGADEWFGLTNPDDRFLVGRRLAELTAAGRYPEELWT